MPDRPVRIPLYYDFASTLCYVAHRVLGRLEEPLGSAGVYLEWRPVDLVELTGWRRGATLAAAPRAHVLAVARSLVGEVRIPRVWVDSRRVATIAIALAGTASEPAWRERVWTGLYEQGDDLADPRMIARWARDVGVDLGAIEEQGESLASATEAARAAGVVAVPTLLLGTWPMAGIQDDATMLALLRRYAER